MGILIGTSGCLLVKPRMISRISELEIDVDKDWSGYGILNLREAAAGMQKGDILVHDGNRLIKISPGNCGDELTTKGSGQLPCWQAPPVS